MTLLKSACCISRVHHQSLYKNIENRDWNYFLCISQRPVSSTDYCSLMFVIPFCTFNCYNKILHRWTCYIRYRRFALFFRRAITFLFVLLGYLFCCYDRSHECSISQAQWSVLCTSHRSICPNTSPIMCVHRRRQGSAGGESAPLRATKKNFQASFVGMRQK